MNKKLIKLLLIFLFFYQRLSNCVYFIDIEDKYKSGTGKVKPKVTKTVSIYTLATPRLLLKSKLMRHS
jgi:hypothetical protein